MATGEQFLRKAEFEIWQKSIARQIAQLNMSIQVGGNISGGSSYGLEDTDDLPEGITNLYHTDERSQDSIGSILDDGTIGQIAFSYDDATPKISANLSHLGLESLADPGADRIMFWDESAPDVLAWLSLGDSLAITATTLDAIQDIRALASPEFAGLTLSGLTASLPIVTNVSKALASLAYTGVTSFRKNLGLEANDTPIFVSIDLTGKAIKTDCKARAYLASPRQENIPNATWTKVLLNGESYDLGSNFDTINNRFTAPVSGYYFMAAQIYWTDIIATQDYMVGIKKNGITYIGFNLSHSSKAIDLGITIADIVYLSATDYLEMWCAHNAGAATPDVVEGTSSTYMAVHLLSID